MTPDIIIYHGDDPAADWQPMTDEPETFDQWNTRRAAAGLPWQPITAYLREANWQIGEWTGATCPRCGGELVERREHWLLCLPCQEIWHGLNELDAARLEVAAQNGE